LQLNPYQERAVRTPGHCTILACPGSGKTKVLSSRSAHLIDNNQLGRLCAVTFTRDAATELLHRITKEINPQDTRRVAVGTFHSLALNQLRRNSKDRIPRLVSEAEKFGILRRCWKEHAPNHNFEEVQAELERSKGSVSEYIFEDIALQKVCRAYQDALQADNAMDFSDILLKATRGMLAGTLPPLPLKWMLVDEGQDMDAVQREWILCHGRHGIEITLVGDDDQSLYSFRHALGYAGLQQVTETLNSVELTLPVNYRCGKKILSHAAKLIVHNTDRAPKNISADRDDDGVIEVKRVADRNGELDEMVRLLATEGRAQWAVLARTNAILDEVEAALETGGIPTKRSGGKSIWESGVAAIFVGLLRSINDDSWTGVANALAFAGGSGSWINAHSREEVKGCIERLTQAVETAPNEQSRKVGLALREGLLSWTTQSQKERVSLVVYGVSGFLTRYCKESQLRLLERVRDSFAQLSGSIGQRLSFISRNDRKDETVSGMVQLLTLHSSKGLEFDNVWIAAVEEGNLPHTDALVEDERRLMYVGMTRARNRLVISSALEEGLESRFLEEAGI